MISYKSFITGIYIGVLTPFMSLNAIHALTVPPAWGSQARRGMTVRVSTFVLPVVKKMWAMYADLLLRRGFCMAISETFRFQRDPLSWIAVSFFIVWIGGCPIPI